MNATVDDRVAKIAKIIGRDTARPKAIEEAIRSFDAQRQRYAPKAGWPPYPLNKKEKTTALSFAKALYRLERQLKRADRGRPC